MPCLIGTEGCLENEGFLRQINPSDMPVTPANAPEVLSEADRALQACRPYGATFTPADRSKALRFMGRYEESEEARRQVPRQLILE